MRTFKKFIAIILAFAIGFSVMIPSASASTESTTEPSTEVSAEVSTETENSPKNFEDYMEILKDGGYPSLSTRTYLKITKFFNTIFRFITGRGFVKRENFNFTADALLTEISTGIANESGFDIILLAGSLPETNRYAEFVTKTFKLDTTAIRDKFYELRFAEDDKGNTVMACVYYFLGLYFSVIEECHAYCEPMEGKENKYEVCFKIILQDGTYERISTGVVVDTETNEVTGKGSKGMAGIGYSFSYEELLVYTHVNVWMRDFGFTFLYDLFSYTTPFFFYDTRRIKFDYADKEWMIQVWKGNYLVSNGAEIGIYTREPGSIGTYYDCANDEQMMNMSMKLYHKDDLLFERPEQLHWWLTGFQLSDVLYPARNLTLDFTIEMQSEEMLKAFCKAIDNHYRHDIKYTVDGLKVNVIW